MSDSELIPFGKYRGRPIEDLASDPQYMEWLIQQPWFAQRHTNLYQIVINNFNEPSETPEHNAMQAKFLDGDWCKKFMDAAEIKRFHGRKNFNQHTFREEGPVVEWIEIVPKVTFEINGIDVILESDMWICPKGIELKPTIGDDYPAILRSMLVAKQRHRGGGFLVVGQFSSQAVTEDQFRAIFKASGIRVVFVREIEATAIQQMPQLPNSEGV